MSSRETTLRLAWTALALALLPASLAAEHLEDPTRPPAALAAPDEAGVSALRVESIWLAEGRRFAVVDGRRVAAGDALAGGRVVAIDLAGVRIRRAGGEDVLLTLGGGAGVRVIPTERTEP